jgi:hypothetical protein
MSLITEDMLNKLLLATDKPQQTKKVKDIMMAAKGDVEEINGEEYESLGRVTRGLPDSITDEDSKESYRQSGEYQKNGSKGQSPVYIRDGVKGWSDSEVWRRRARPTS